MLQKEEFAIAHSGLHVVQHQKSSLITWASQGAVSH